MNTGAESTNFNSLIAKRSENNIVYANTVNATANHIDSNYQKNNPKLRKPRGKTIFIPLPKLPFSKV